MKVCMVSKHFFPYAGGLEVRVLELAKWLVRGGDDVLVLTSHEDGTVGCELMEGVVVKRSRSWFSIFNALFTPGVFLNLMREDYDLIDINLPDPVNSISAYIASLLRGKPLVVTYHADIVKEGLLHLPFKVVYYPLLHLILGRASRIFVTSPDYAESSPVASEFIEKVVVAPSFVDLGKYSPRVDGSGVRRELGDGKMVLFVGRLVAYKGVDYLIEACGLIEDAVLVIVGDGPLRGRLEAKVSEMGLGNVRFVGRVPESRLPEYYAACDVLALPSVTRQEAFGLVLVEAIASGKPVVSSNFSGMPYVVGDAGLLVEPRNPMALKDALERVLGGRKLAAELGRRGRRRAEELFGRDMVCELIRNVYKATVHKD